MSDDTKKLLKKWVKLDEDIKNLENKINLLKSKKKLINPILEKYMIDNDIHKININSNYCLHCSEKNYYKPINKSYITKTLEDMIDDIEKRNKIIEFIYNNRDIITKNILLIKTR